jgi:molybdopterin-guanine dinucleotide biosynthesis protein A
LEAVSGFEEVLLVTKFPEKFFHLKKKFKNLTIVPESFKGFSPVYGIVTGLKNAVSRELLFFSADLPLLRREVVNLLSRELPPAVVFDGERVHSLMCKISKFQLPMIEEFLKSGRHRLTELHSVLGSRLIPFEKFRVFDFKKNSLLNVNRKEDYLEAVLR